MSADPTVSSAASWKTELPALSGRLATLRELAPQDLGPLVDLLSLSDSCRFGIEDAINEVAAQHLIERAPRDRTTGLSFIYAIVSGRSTVGVIQVRQLDPMFEAAEWECTIAPSSR